MDANPAITPDELVNVLFSTTRFRIGYDQHEVDNHLDAIVKVMHAHLAGQDTARLPHSRELAEVAFTPTRWRDGYDPDEVDDVMLRAQHALAVLEARSARG